MSAPSGPRLVGLTAVVVALAAAVAITGGRGGAVERPLLVPGMTVADVTTLTITRGAEPPIVVAIAPDHADVTAPVPGPADEAVVRDLLSAIAAARADRVADSAAAFTRAGLANPRIRVTLRGSAKNAEILVGAAVPASGQVWLGRAGRAYLVPAWVGDALDRDLAVLRRRRPFAANAVMTGLELHGLGVDLVLAGVPLRRRDEGAGVRVSAEARARVGAALAAITLDVLVAGDVSQPPQLGVRVLGGAAPVELEVHGVCPGAGAAVVDHVLVAGSAGVGCVPRANVDALVAAARVLAGHDGVLTAPLEGGVEAIRVEGGAALERRGAGWSLTQGTETADADDDAVAALFAALARPGTLAAGAAVSAKPDAVWAVNLEGGAVERWAWWWPSTFRRDDEPVALAVAPATAAAARGFGQTLRDRTALIVEATAVAGIEASGAEPVKMERGELVGDWRVLRPAGAAATPAVGTLIDALGQVRGSAWLGEAELGKVRRTVTVTVDAAPVMGATRSSHVIAVGAARAGGGCAIRIDSLPPLAVDAGLCGALLAPLAR